MTLNIKNLYQQDILIYRNKDAGGNVESYQIQIGTTSARISAEDATRFGRYVAEDFDH